MTIPSMRVRFELLGMLILSCCGVQPPKERFAVTTQYSDGQLHTYQEFIADSVQDGPYVRWYHNGAIDMVINYREGHRNGLECAYHENGMLDSRFTNVDGAKEGVGTWYYPIGTLQGWVWFHVGDKISPGLIFREDGSLKAAIAYGKNDEVVYRVDLLPDSSIKDQNGKVPDHWERMVSDALRQARQ